MATITATASGRAQGEPDEARVLLAVEATADDPGAARRRLAEVVPDVRAALGDADVDEDDVVTTEYRVRERRPPEVRRGESDAVEHRAEQTFRVAVPDVDRVGEIVDAGVDAGATSVRNVDLGFSEARRRELRRRALDDAMGNAREQADVLAERAKRSITGVESVVTGEDERARAHGRERGVTAGGGGDAAPPTSVDAGELTVVATVEVTYAAE